MRSLAIITVLIPLAALGVLGLATVVFIHELAEVLVIANAIRAAKVETRGTDWPDRRLSPGGPTVPALCPPRSSSAWRACRSAPVRSR
ncbi:hypothetical protein [Streptomyces luteogriseus]|uniref:hypothetical protein n=1 Tax=Streptomyces luteogriseus TaxID=68233 RepID=UPI002E37E29E|nr:hypothetical protein [Streptomyces luteogriseus]